MSFSSDIKDELKRKYFVPKSRQSRAAAGDNEEARERLRKQFIECGSISDPERFYHLEFAAEEQTAAEAIGRDMLAFGIFAHYITRKKYHVVYIKDSEAISEMLNVLGAHQSMMEFENIRILKEVRGSVQRQVNCETANLQKTVNASVRQLDDIRFIIDNGNFGKLPEPLKTAAELRLSNPDATLSELAVHTGGAVSRSGLNHRFTRLSRIADELRREINDRQEIQEENK